MKRIAKHYSGIRFTRASVAMGLTALLCMPLQASAEESTSTAPVAQAVQQSRTVKGQVVDEMGEPMIGVTVRVKGTGKGTITDMDGRFSIQAESNATLEISFVGYKTQTFKASKTNYQLKMELDNTGLDEVVVIGYGTQKKRDLTGAITSIKSEDITAAPLPNPIESLCRVRWQVLTLLALLVRLVQQAVSSCVVPVRSLHRRVAMMLRWCWWMDCPEASLL